MKKFFFYLLFIPLLSLSDCEDDLAPKDPIDQLPPETQTGANTFGCLINGVPFIVKNTSHQVAIYQQGHLQFGGGGVSMRVNEPFSINNQIDLIGKARYIVNPDEVSCYYDFEDAYKGFVKFTKIDQVNHILSGTFEFSTVTEDCDTIRITNGRFDMRYTP